MDQHSGSLPTSSSYSSLPSIAPQQLQYNNAPPTPHTLPPLQGQHGGLPMHPMYAQPMSAPHTPTSSAPNSSISAVNGGFQQMGGQAGLRGYHHQGAPQYQQSLQSFNTSGPMMPPSSLSMSHPQSMAPAPTSSINRLVPIRPMTSAPPLHMQHGAHPQLQPAFPSPYAQHLGQTQEPPTHVVGSQGRRGILPSAPGRPAVTATGPGSTKNAPVPAKDENGKFPCPHCTKTYLHAKHLKRHLLRHTGDRPYMCVLCHDTFSRSDILKRHFQKCSIRRGNPNGVSHLSAQAHLKKSTSRTAVEDLMRNMNGTSALPNDHLVPFGVIADVPERRGPVAGQPMSAEQFNQEQANNAKQLSGGPGTDRLPMTAPNSNRASFDHSQMGNNMPTTMSAINPQMASYSMPNGHNAPGFNQSYELAARSNGGTLQPQDDASGMANGRGGMPMFGGTSNAQQSGGDWSQMMFQPGAQDGFMNSYHTNLVQNQIATKAEPSMTLSNDISFTGVYPIATGTDVNGHSMTNYPGWNTSFSQIEIFQKISNQLINFCWPPNSQSAAQPNSASMRTYLSPSNVKHFLEQFANFQGHFPLLHMSTFNIQETWPGLLLAMSCVGAVYSDRISSEQVRELMEPVKIAVEKSSRVYSSVTWDQNAGNYGEPIGSLKADLEEMHAMFLLHVLYTWHGTPIQRENARRNFPLLVKLAEKTELGRPSIAPASYSVLHQPNVVAEHFNAASFNWKTWIEQEKRSRLFYMIFLCDAAMVLYFNIPPQFDSFALKLPLPADDAAWEAQTDTQCADALGLRGPAAAKDRHVKGSGRAKQPEMNVALKALLDLSDNLSSGTTNLYSKFILVHALLVQIWYAHGQAAQDAVSPSSRPLPPTRSGTSTPSSQNDVNGHLNGNHSSQRASPVSGQEPKKPVDMMDMIDKALNKWKQAWDGDMAIQYPPSSTSYRRFGFCRDGVHFFYLAKYLLKNKWDSQMAPDQRLSYVFHILKQLKAWVATDSANRGEELGSVNDIDQGYGVSNLTLDMAQLFKPIDKQTDSPVQGVHTNLGSNMM